MSLVPVPGPAGARMAGLTRPGTGDRYRTFRSAASRDCYGAGVVARQGAGYGAGVVARQGAGYGPGVVAGQGPGYGPADVLVLSRGHVLSCCSRCGYVPLATKDSLPVAMENCYLSGTTPVVGLVPLS